jgi:hypothetical protein
MKLIPIHTSPNEIQARLIKGYLENNGIKSIIRPDSLTFRGRFSGTTLHDAEWMIYVRKDQAEKAKKILVKVK